MMYSIYRSRAYNVLYLLAQVSSGQFCRCWGPSLIHRLLLEFLLHLEVLVCPAHNANHAAKYCLLDLLVLTNSSMWIRVLYVAVFGSHFTGTGSSLTILSHP